MLAAPADDIASKVDERYPFRTDFANADLPWYVPKNGEFPPHHSDRRISGELVSADFIHRTGQFRATHTGELIDFSMPPYGSVIHLNAEADLRDVPLGTFFLFFLNQDSQGNFNRLATMQDQFSIDAGHRFSYRLDELMLAEGKLLCTKQSLAKQQPDLGKKELLVTAATRVWRGDKQIALADLKPGDDMLYNLTGKTAKSPGRCVDIWVGAETHQLATKTQRDKFTAFTKFRGLPGWIDRTSGNELTATLFSGDTKSFQQTWKDDLKVGAGTNCCVANDELRTWNPPVDKEKGTIKEVKYISTDAHGNSGVQIVFTVNYMLEGFRRGRVVRVFGAGWPLKDQFYGESLMGYGYARLLNQEVVECTPKEYPAQFPFRTDYGNEHLPWYQVRVGEAPPKFAEHVMFGELVSVDAEHQRGQFRQDRTGKLVDFTLLSTATLARLNAPAKLGDLPPGQRYRFHMFQNTSGNFTQVNLIADEYSHLAQNALTYRIEALRLDEGKLNVARQMPQVKNYNGDMEAPPDVARTELRVSDATQVWTKDGQAKLADLKLGDVVLVNLTGEQTGNPSRCTDLWVGVETHQQVTEQAKQQQTAKK
ncbi:MAG: hypothetical protein JSS27_04635 [Planctomycetes bacterium]|nr:hypothetical protein [Planctomycetota bacterium]